jgi:hypothetical protein
MDYDYERAKKKEEELNKLAEEAISIYWKEVGITGREIEAVTFAKEITKHFITINPPEKASWMSFDLVKLGKGGGGGGKSVKAGNIFLNFRKLIGFFASSALSIISTVNVPWTAPLAAIVLWDRLWSNLEIELSEREAAIIWAMWLNKDSDNCLLDSELLNHVNSELKKNGRNPISRQEMDDSLEKLKKIGCIEIPEYDSSKWWLCEYVKISYR